MASRVINETQNFDDQYFEKLGFPMIFCNYHQQSVIDSININHSNNNKLICTKCIIKDRLDSEYFISIQDIFSKNPNNIIQNWPPLLDLNIYQKLMADNVQESKKNQSLEQINQFFEILKVDVIKAIDEHQKKILIHINSIEENRQKVIDIYNQISDKDEIKNQFLNHKNNQNQLEQNLKQIISLKQTQCIDNKQKINKTIDEYTKSQQQFQFDYIEKLFNQFLTELNQIDPLNPFLSTNQQFQTRIQNKKNNQGDNDENIDNQNENQICEEMNSNNSQNIQIIESEVSQKFREIREKLELISSIKLIKSNGCKTEYISFKKISNDQFIIERDSNSASWSQVLIDEELKPQIKYQIQFELKSQNIRNDCIMLGLMPISKIDLDGWRSTLSLYTNIQGYGIDKIESGKHISSIRSDTKQISFQICLQEKILRCLAIVNNEKNINSQSDWNKLQQNEKYYFYIGLYLPDSKIEFQSFKIVEQFEQW